MTGWLLTQWNNLRFSDFMKTSGSTKQSALREMCSTASGIQLQIGMSYQGPQHLRDAHLTAYKNEKRAHRLWTMPTNGLLDIEESLARAITAQKNLGRLTRNISPAYRNKVNYNDNAASAVNFIRDLRGMPYGTYKSDRNSRQRKGASRII